MGKIGKIIGVLVLLVVIAVAGLVAFVHFYLTEDKVKELIIPQAEAALDRKVAIGDIGIGLFSGITINDFLIKETDGKENFVTTKAFVLSYDLMPLLQKKLVISEIRFDEPTVQVIRDRQGRFNFATLAILSEKSEEKGEEKKTSVSPALPLALTFNQISLNRAKVKIRDMLGEIPAVDATSSARFNVSLGQALKELQYSGTFDLDAAVEYGSAKPRFTGKGSIDNRNINIVLDTDLDGEKVHAEADVSGYLTAPDVTVNVTSKSLNVDKLLAMVAGLPKSSSGEPAQPEPEKDRSKEVIADSLPPGLVANGTVKVDKALYKGITTQNLALAFNLSKGILTVSDLSAQAYSGQLDSNMKVDLNKPGMEYDGKLALQSVQADGLTSALVQKAAGMLTGSLQTAMNFSGAGTTWNDIKKVLNADGSFTLEDGGIKGTPVSNSISNLLGLQELSNITYKNISGTFKIIEGGKVKIKSNMQGDDLGADAEGIIGLDGSLDLPLTLHLSPPLAEKLRSRASFAKYLSDEEGGSTLHLKLAGTLKNPRPTLDMAGVQNQLKKSIKQKLLDKLGGSDQESQQETTEQESSPQNLIKGLFGR